MGNSDDKRRLIATTSSKYKGQQLYPELLRKTCSKDLKKNMQNILEPNMELGVTLEAQQTLQSRHTLPPSLCERIPLMRRLEKRFPDRLVQG